MFVGPAGDADRARPFELGDLADERADRAGGGGHHHGETVLAYGGWQDFAVSNGQGLRKLDPSAAPVTTAWRRPSRR
jgi:NADPH-dependent curcumin reductase CurA